MQEMAGLLAQYGLVLVFANVFVTQIGAPLPAVPTLIVAGAFVAQGELSVAPLVAVTIAASLLADTPWYLAGRRYGTRVLRTLCRIAIEPDSCVKQTENIFERWGAPSLMVAKFIPGFATVAPPIAGAMRVGFGRFAAFSAVGATLWAGIAVAIGAVFHDQIEQVLARLEDMGRGALLVIGAVIGFYIAVKWFERYMFIRFLRMVRITVDELHELMQRGANPVVLDARSAAARRLNPHHIPGAIAVDMVAPERHLGAVPPDEEVVVYCS